MAKTYTSILRGGLVDMYVAAAGTTTPVATNVIDFSGWTELGYIDGGVTLEFESGFWEAQADQSTVVLRRELISERARVTFNALETALAILLYGVPGSVYAAGAVDGTNEHTWTVGGLAAGATEYSLGFECVGSDTADGANQQSAVWFPRCHAIGAVAVPYLKDGNRIFPFQFESLGDTTQSAGAQLCSYFEITEADT